jgi:hypothetical protein
MRAVLRWRNFEERLQSGRCARKGTYADSCGMGGAHVDFLSPRWGWLLFLLSTHGLRCGLHSSAALRLLLVTFSNFSSTLVLLFANDLRLATRKTLGVITPTAGARSRRIRVTCLHLGFRMSLTVPHSHGEVAGVASFLGLARRPSGPYATQISNSERRLYL